MNNIRTIKGGVNLKGKIKVPGDKSISHRALIIGSIAKGKTTIEGFLYSEDPLSTADCLRKLGANIPKIIKQTSLLDHHLKNFLNNSKTLINEKEEHSHLGQDLFLGHHLQRDNK